MTEKKSLVNTACECFDQMMQHSRVLYSSADIHLALNRIADHLNQAFASSYPLVLSLMGGAVVFVGHLMPRLSFALEFDYVHLSRYGDTFIGGSVNWQMGPLCDLSGRTVIVLDDIVDSGRTVIAVRERLASLSVSHVEVVSLCDRVLPVHEKKASPDYFGLSIAEDFIFGFGMDAHSFGRNLPEIRAMTREQKELIFPGHSEVVA